MGSLNIPSGVQVFATSFFFFIEALFFSLVGVFFNPYSIGIELSIKGLQQLTHITQPTELDPRVGVLCRMNLNNLMCVLFLGHRLTTTLDEVIVYPIPAALYLVKNLLQVGGGNGILLQLCYCNRYVNAF